MSNIKRCIAYNKRGKRCRTRLSENNKYFCCEKHIPPNYETIKESCYICSNELKIENMIILRCNHIHHIGCLSEWFQMTSESDNTFQCPLCRQDIFIDYSIKKNKKKKFNYYEV